MKAKQAGENVFDVGNVAALNPRTLLHRVYTAVHQVDWPRPHPAIQRETPEPVLRTMVTYCYAAGTFSAQDIQAACLHDPTVRYICANDFPTWETIREFRRRNLPFIKQALEHLFLDLDRNTGLLRARIEAERRLARAVQADSMALDV